LPAGNGRFTNAAVAKENDLELRRRAIEVGHQGRPFVPDGDMSLPVE
jgi:hypothetical protein